MILDKAYYLDTFGVDERQLSSLAGEGIARGGDFSDLFFEHSMFQTLQLRDGVVASGGFHIDYGVGIRVLTGEKTGYAYAESTESAAMKEAARAASLIADGATPVREEAASRAKPAGKPNPAADRYPLRTDWREIGAEALSPWLEKLEKKVRQKEPRALKVMASLSSQVSDILIFNSFGELVYDTRPYASLAVSVVFGQEGKIEQKTASRSWMKGAEMLDESLVEALAADVVSGIDARFEARRPKGGKMSVVMGAGASGILLHEAMGHAFEADFNRKGQSVFSGKIGSKVCGSGITIVDDGMIRGNRGAVNFDDEGVPGQRTEMVRDGVLTSYLHDRISARYYGVSPTGNGRRESFRFMPLPRMRATYMESGSATPADIIASVSRGIYVDEFSNGQVKIGEGDFTFYVKSGFLIENGALTQPVKDINIIGNGPEALADIVAVGNDLKVDEGAWTCGKGQSCPVSCGIPTVLVRQLTVGGE